MWPITEELNVVHYRGTTSSKRKIFYGSTSMLYDEVKKTMDKLDRFMVYKGTEYICEITWNESLNIPCINFSIRGQ